MKHEPIIQAPSDMAVVDRLINRLQEMNRPDVVLIIGAAMLPDIQAMIRGARA